MMGIAVAQGKQEMVSGWATAAAIFKEMSGYLYAVLQALVLAMGPLVIIAMFIPGTGLKLVGSYMQVAVWLALWQPLLSIVNYIVLLYSQAQSTAVMGGSTGFTMQNIPVVSEFTSRMMLAGSFMATLVPLFAWGMVKGGMAVTDLITRGLSNQIMSQAGNVAATGNVTLGNESMNDSTIDQNMLMPKFSVGYGMTNAAISGNGMVLDSNQGGLHQTIAGSAVTISQTATQQVAAQKDIAEAKGLNLTANDNITKGLADLGSITNNSGSGTDASVTSGKHSQGGHGATTTPKSTSNHHQVGASQTTTVALTHNTQKVHGSKSSVGGNLGVLEGLAAIAGAVALIKTDPGESLSLLGRLVGIGTKVAPGAARGAAGLITRETAGAAVLGGTVGAVAGSASHNWSNSSTRGKGTGTSVEAHRGENYEHGSANSESSKAEILYQAVKALKGSLTNGTQYTQEQRASIQKAIGHFSAASKELKQSEKLTKSASFQKTVIVPNSYPMGSGLTAESVKSDPGSVEPFYQGQNIAKAAHHMGGTPLAQIPAHLEHEANVDRQKEHKLWARAAAVKHTPINADGAQNVLVHGVPREAPTYSYAARQERLTALGDKAQYDDIRNYLNLIAQQNANR